MYTTHFVYEIRPKQEGGSYEGAFVDREIKAYCLDCQSVLQKLP
jgi:hypothetical protein